MEPESPPGARPRPMGFELPGLGSDPAAVRQRLEAVEKLLERSLTVPGTNVPIGLDAIAGLIPVVGDVFDFAFRSNSRNLKIVKRHLDKHHPATRVIEG